jgi:hypothetical protein
LKRKHPPRHLDDCYEPDSPLPPPHSAKIKLSNRFANSLRIYSRKVSVFKRFIKATGKNGFSIKGNKEFYENHKSTMGY